MGQVIRIDRWRERAASGPDASPAPDAQPDPSSVDRLEQAVQRLDRLTGGMLRSGDRLDPSTETALLAIVGEMSMGRVDEAAARTEDLVQRLAAQR